MLAAALALAAWGGAHARPAVSLFEPDEDRATFSSASAARVAHNPHFGLSSTSSDDDDDGRFVKIHFDDAHVSNGLHLGSAADKIKLHDQHEPRAVPVSAIPEPSTYALFAAGMVGIAIVTRRRRSGDA
ncbi:MAG TPA: PEP-CTERM sorting domain-containing protein [Burkholderiaceae bacterium]